MSNGGVQGSPVGALAHFTSYPAPPPPPPPQPGSSVFPSGDSVRLGDCLFPSLPQQVHGAVPSIGVMWQPIAPPPPSTFQQPNALPPFSSFQPPPQQQQHHRSPTAFAPTMRAQQASTVAAGAAAVTVPGAWGAPPPLQLSLPAFLPMDGHGGGILTSDRSLGGSSLASLPSAAGFGHQMSTTHAPIVVPSSSWSSSETSSYQAKSPQQQQQPQQQHSYVPQHPGIFVTTGPRLIGGRLRSGSNVHTALKDVCQYFSYVDPLPARDALSTSSERPSGPQVLPLFVQMFPHEHMDNAQVVFDIVMCLICGPGAGRAVGVEPRSDTSFLVHVQTDVVWHVLYNLRCRVLMDRHGFWYAGSIAQYVTMREYCDRLRNLPQQARHTAADGMPSLPLVVELARAVPRSSVSAPSAPPPFDVQVPR